MAKDNKRRTVRQSESVKDELGEKFLSLMPGLPAHLVKVFRMLERFDGRNAATLMSRMESVAKGYVPKPTGREAQTLEKIRLLLCRPSLQQEIKDDLRDMARRLKREAFQDGRASLLLKLIGEADARLPFVSLVLLRDHAHPVESFRPQCEPADLIAEAERATGERRARAVVRAYRETAEWLYYPYLRTLWVLTLWARGERQPEPKADGQLVIQLARKLGDYPGLVEEDVGWRRNAAAHGHWEYVDKGDSINMWDERRPKSNIPVGELYAKLVDMYLIAGPTFARVGQLYLLRNVALNTGMAGAFINNIPRLLSEEEAERAAAEAEIEEKAERVFGPLRSFVNSCAQPAAAPGA